MIQKMERYSQDPTMIGSLALAIRLATTPTDDEERQSIACDAIVEAFGLHRAYVIQDVAAFICEALDAYPEYDPKDFVAVLGLQNCDRIKAAADRLTNLVEALHDYAKEDASGKPK